MIYALIELLQNSVKLGKRDIFSTIMEEIALVESYVAIANVRYPDAFTLNILSDPHLQGYCVPRILIQPLVENALLHGIIPSQRFGTIQVTIRSVPKTETLGDHRVGRRDRHCKRPPRRDFQQGTEKQPARRGIEQYSQPAAVSVQGTIIISPFKTSNRTAQSLSSAFPNRPPPIPS